MARRKRNLRQAFIATVGTATAAAAALGGCGNEVTTSNPPFPQNALCPAQQPAEGGPCSDDGLTCHFGEDCSDVTTASCTDGTWSIQEDATPEGCTCPASQPSEGEACESEGLSCPYDSPDGCGSEARCTDGQWSLQTWSCNPPPPACPETMPTEGSLCEEQPDTRGGYPTGCSYTVSTPCGDAPVSASCEYVEDSPDAVWALTYPEPCEALPEECADYADAGACGADPGCQWLLPGCAEGTGAPPATEGCYPIGDCLQDGCGSWGVCETLIHDPCAGSSCSACGAEVHVCVASSDA